MNFDTFYESIMSGLAKDMSLEDICKKHNVTMEDLTAELNKGIEVEKEHTGSEQMAKKIAMDHLVENPKYYTKLAQAKL